tara:strand:+ start:5025 stop:5927 length:903 start_codon:yes stop_codon:yes gene_type:complete
MEFKKGYKYKPSTISKDGVVLFTDGNVNDLSVNQRVCEAYGYKFNAFNGTCEVKNKGIDLKQSLKKKDNNILGINNRIEGKSKSISLNGMNHTAKGQTCNTIINGSNHTLDTQVANAAILSGNNAIAIRTGETIIGGSKDVGLNDSSSNLTEYRTQTSKFHLSGRFLAGDDTLYPSLSGLDVLNGIPMPINSLSILKASIVTSQEGSAKYNAQELTCMITCNASGVTAVNNVTTNVISSTIPFLLYTCESGTTSSNNVNEIFIKANLGLGRGGATGTTVVSIGIELTEQVHDINTNIITN